MLSGEDKNSEISETIVQEGVEHGTEKPGPKEELFLL